MSAAATATPVHPGHPAAGVQATAFLLPAAIVAMLGVMLVPLPPFALDLLLVLSIAASLATLIIAASVEDPLSFSVFPSLLLVLTLFRLGLNVASTRLVLTNGGTSEEAAGRVIGAFGHFLIGGNVVVGLVVFAILLVINFVVVTKGAGRVAEVAARFTLDALPGKQMAIDADLNAGLIDEATARTRRAAVAREADFHGAMDGASKFVRGDAIAALVITAINLVGGFAVGVLQNDLSVRDAAARYVVLSVGDGLVSQVPALLVSVAAAMTVTRVSKAASLAAEFSQQLGSDRAPLYGAAAVVGGLGLLPGLPFLPFAAVAVLTAGAAALTKRGTAQVSAAPPPPPPTEEAELQARMRVEPLSLHVGFELVTLLDSQRGGDLGDRIGGLRRRIAEDLGVIVPPVRITDDSRLAGGHYTISLHGVTIARGEVLAERYLAMDPTGALPSLPGIRGRDPAFGVGATWIIPGERESALAAGYTVVPASAVVTTHLSEVVRRHAHELVGRDDLARMLDEVAARHPKLVKELVPEALAPTVVLAVLRNLLRESVPIRDLRSILDALAEAAPSSRDPEVLTEHVRRRLGRAIASRLAEKDGTLPVAVCDPAAEDVAVRGARAEGGAAAFERLVSAVTDTARAMVDAGRTPVFLVGADARRPMRALLARVAPGAHAISYEEVGDGVRLKTIGRVTLHGERASIRG